VRAVGFALVALAVSLVACAVAFGGNARSALRERRRTRRLDRPEVVMRELIEGRAHENYRLLQRSSRLLDRLLATDQLLPVFHGEDERREARAIVREFNGQMTRTEKNE
jgi:hypothetical protein